jgi:hypothetical protein
MPWSRAQRNQAILLLGVVVPVLMFGLGVGGFLIAKLAGFGNNAVWIALALSTLGFAISIYITLKMGDRYEDLAQKSQSPPASG